MEKCHLKKQRKQQQQQRCDALKWCSFKYVHGIYIYYIYICMCMCLCLSVFIIILNVEQKKYNFYNGRLETKNLKQK